MDLIIRIVSITNDRLIEEKADHRQLNIEIMKMEAVMSAINFDALRYTKTDGQIQSGSNTGGRQLRDFSEEIRKLKGNISGSDDSGASVRDARQKVLQYQEDLERELLLRSKDPSRGRRKEEEEHVLFENKHDSAFESKTLAELAGMKPDDEINWDADGTDELTEEQLRYLKEKYDVENLTQNEFCNLLAELSKMNAISCEEIKKQLWRPGDPEACATGYIVRASDGHFSQWFNSRRDYLSQFKNENNSILAEIFDRIKQGVSRMEES